MGRKAAMVTGLVAAGVAAGAWWVADGPGHVASGVGGSASVDISLVTGPDSASSGMSAALRPLGDAGTAVSRSSSAGQVTFSAVDPGRYQIRLATARADLDVSSVACSPDSVVVSDAGLPESAVLALIPGQHVSCVATGEERGHVTIRTVAQPPGADPTVTIAPSWSQPFEQTVGEMHRSPPLTAAAHHITAEPGPGWDITAADCDNGRTIDDVVLAPGDDVTCTVHVARRGRITVEVVTQPERKRRFQMETSWGSTIAVAGGGSHVTRPLRAGTYELTPLMPEGWDVTSFGCDDESPGDAIDLDPGERLTCTLSATKRGTISISLTTEPAGAAPDVTFDPSWGRSFTLAGGDTYESRALRPKGHEVRLRTPDGWDVGRSTCSGPHSLDRIDLRPGRDVECDVVLTQRGTITVLATAATPGPGRLGVSPSWGDPFQLTDEQSATSPELEPGVYSAETEATGWWSVQSSTCSDGSSTDAISLDPGEEVLCTVRYARTRFTAASFNILGASHTERGGYAARYASGATRMG